MSLSNSVSTQVTFHEPIEIPSGVAAAFNRSLDILSRSDSFVDRCYSLGNLCDSVIAWRWAHVIDQRQCSYLLRKLRRTVQEDLGNITEDEFRSANEVFESEERSEELTREIEEEALRSAH